MSTPTWTASWMSSTSGSSTSEASSLARLAESESLRRCWRRCAIASTSRLLRCRLEVFGPLRPRRGVRLVPDQFHQRLSDAGGDTFTAQLFNRIGDGR
jgi:hypothetical protein